MTNSNIRERVVFISNPAKFERIESKYIQVRLKEGRILTDEQVAKLPYSTEDVIHHYEWKLRARSYKRVLSLLKKRNPATLLDIGCGNGWLINSLSAELPGCQSSGVDLNQKELNQASRLSVSDDSHFYYLDILNDSFFQKELFEAIIFNASIQYFKNLAEIIDIAKSFLKPGGILLVNDSLFYKNSSVAAEAAKRSEAYYRTLGIPEMSENYFHHNKPELLAMGFHKYRNRTSMIIKYSFPLFIYKKL